MNQREYRIGPGAASLMLLVVVLSMSALGMLAMMSARSDESLSLRSQDVARQVAELNVSAEQSLARLDAVLADAARTAQSEADYLARVEAALAEAPVTHATALSPVITVPSDSLTPFFTLMMPMLSALVC